MLIFLNLLACKYNPDGTSFNEIPIKNPETLNINLNVTTDTILILNRTNFSFNLDNQNLRILELKVYLNDSVIYSTANYHGNFVIEPYQMHDGTYKLKVVTVTNTNTNNLSDVLGTELQTFTKECTVIVDYSAPSPVKIKSVQMADGSVKLEWEKYTRPNFTYYKVNIYDVSGQFPNLIGGSYPIYKQDSTIFYDRNFLGGKVKYEVCVWANNVNKMSVSQPKNFEYDYSEISATTSIDSITIKWSKCPFYNNFGKYHILLNAPYGLIYSSNQINDTVFTYKGGTFGSYISFMVELYSKKNTGDYPNNTLYVSTLLGDYFPFYDDLKFLKNDKALIVSNNVISQYDLLQKTFGNSFQLPSNNNLYGLYIYNTSYKSDFLCYSNGNQIFVKNNSDFSLKNTLNLPTDNPKTGAKITCSRLEVSDNNIMAFSMIPLASYSYEKLIFIYDLNTNSYIDTIEDSNKAYNINISSLGNYLYLNSFSMENSSIVYKIEPRNSHIIGNIDYSSNRTSFIPDTDNQIFTIPFNNTGIAQIINLETFSTISSFSVPLNTFITCIDKETNNIGLVVGNNEPYYFKYYQPSGILIKTIPTSNHASRIRYNDGTLYTSGFMLKL